jgi:hypothetical protein
MVYVKNPRNGELARIPASRVGQYMEAQTALMGVPMGEGLTEEERELSHRLTAEWVARAKARIAQRPEERRTT